MAQTEYGGSNYRVLSDTKLMNLASRVDAAIATGNWQPFGTLVHHPGHDVNEWSQTMVSSQVAENLATGSFTPLL